MRRHAKAPYAGSTTGGVRRQLWGLLALATVSLVLTAPAAEAAPTAVPAYGYAGSFGSQGQIGTVGEFAGASGSIAVEPGTGNVVVAELGNGRISFFAPNSLPDTPALATVATGGNPRSIAFDPVSGALYVVDRDSGLITRYLPDGTPTPTYTLDPGFSVKCFS